MSSTDISCGTRVVVVAAVLLLGLPAAPAPEGATGTPPSAVADATSAPAADRVAPSPNTARAEAPISQTVVATPSAGPGQPGQPGQDIYLSDTDHAEGSNPYRGSIEISGRHYLHSVYQIGREGQPVATQFDLRRQCDELVLTAGITDDSSSAASARFGIYGDDRLLASTELGHGTGEQIIVDVTGMLRLELQNVLISSPNAYFRAGWGDASVRCGASLE